VSLPGACCAIVSGAVPLRKECTAGAGAKQGLRMDYSNVEKYLNTYVDYEVIPGFGFAEAGYSLSHVCELLRRLGNPHVGPLTVHVAGSKGKGTISALIASALHACGLRTGLYTSPHLLHLGERIKVNDACVLPEQLINAWEAMQPHIDDMAASGNWRTFTYFELITVLAFLHFRSMGVAAQVVEVGLGGRLDATNVVSPDICVIAPISLEHTSVLGKTIEEIASQKAGIIKPGASVVSAPQPDGARRTIEAASAAIGVVPLLVGEHVTFETVAHSLEGQAVRVKTLNAIHTYHTRLAGTYQAENIATAVAALEALVARGTALNWECVIRGFADTSWPGRFHVLARAPLLILDGAHNPTSMRRLAESLLAHGLQKNLVFVLGMSGDKDVRGTAKELVQLGARVILTRSHQPRALEPRSIALRINDLGLEIASEREMLRALCRARCSAGEHGSVCVAGSLYLVAEVLDWWQKDDTARSRWALGPDAITCVAGQ